LPNSFSCGDSARFWFMPPLKRLRDHTHWTHHSGRVISPKHRTLPDKTQLTKEKNPHTVSGIPTHNFGKGAAAHPRLIQRSCLIRKIHFSAYVNKTHVSSLLTNCSRRCCSFWKLRCKTCISLQKWWYWTALQTQYKHS
jgi:hypothetical protein